MVQPICPNCSREFVKRVSREGVKERLFSIFYVYPFRCQLCGHRFRFRQWGVRYVRVEEDRREYYRLSMNFPVSFSGDNLNGKGAVADISIAGCTFRTDTQLALGNIVSMALQISNEPAPVTVEAAVVRNVKGDRIGVEFLRFQQNERERLRHFIRGLVLGRCE